MGAEGAGLFDGIDFLVGVAASLGSSLDFPAEVTRALPMVSGMTPPALELLFFFDFPSLTLLLEDASSDFELLDS